jgi:hypothetical protein
MPMAGECLTTRNRARAAGAFAVVEKPYQVEEILDLLRLAMDQR